MKCFNCGTDNLEENTFCVNCGANLKVNFSEPVQRLQATEVEQPNVAMPVENLSQPVTNTNEQQGQVFSSEIPYNTIPEQSQQATPIINQPINEESNRTKNTKLIIFIIIGILFLGVIIFIGFKIFNKNNKSDINGVGFLNESNLIAVKKNGKYGYINTDGKFVTEAKYDELSEFYGDYGIGKIKDSTGFLSDVLIDKTGKEKITFNNSVTDMKYLSTTGGWLINGQIYDSNLKVISPDGITVSPGKDTKYFSFNSNGEIGIIDASGKIKYKSKLRDDQYFITLEVSKVEFKTNNVYCSIGDYSYSKIVNCESGKVIYEDNVHISAENNNVFSTYPDNTYMYIQNDQILYKSTYEIDAEYNNSSPNTITIDDRRNSKTDDYYYIDIKTGKFVSNQETQSDIVTKDPWEEYTGYKLDRCSNKYGISKSNTIIIPCEWDKIEFIDLQTYKYLESKGKKYVIATSSKNKSYLLELEKGKIVHDFKINPYNKNYSYMDIIPTMFILDASGGEKYIYSLLNNKEKKIDNNTLVKRYFNYFTETKDGKVKYYNTDMKLIYTEESEQ